MQFQKITILFPSLRMDKNFLGGSVRPKHLIKCIKLNWNFLRGGRSWNKSHLWGRYRYFLELLIIAGLKKLEFQFAVETGSSQILLVLVLVLVCFVNDLVDQQLA